MKQVVSNIASLLYQYDCVIIPDFGGFITNYRPASDDDQGLLRPPTKDIAFNEELRLNDGLLVNFIAKESGLTYQQAQQEVHAFAKTCMEALNRREVVYIPNVGKFYLDLENNLQFQAEHTNFLTDAFGLPNVYFHPVEAELVKHTPLPQQDTPIIQLEPNRPIMAKKGFNFTRIALLAACIFVVYFFYQRWNNTNTGTEVDLAEEQRVKEGLQRHDDEDELQNDETHTGMLSDVVDSESDADYMVEENEPVVVETMETVSATNTYAEEDEVLDADEVEVSVVSKEEIENNKEIIDPVVRRTGNRDYLIVVGCFGNSTNAQKLANKIDRAGYQSDLGWRGELRRVGVSVNCHPDELQGKLAEVRRKFSSPSAWVMK